MFINKAYYVIGYNDHIESTCVNVITYLFDLLAGYNTAFASVIEMFSVSAEGLTPNILL